MANQKRVFEIKWTIEKAILWLTMRDDTLYSPQIHVESLSDTHWKLSLSSNWLLAEKYVTLALQRDVEDDLSEPIDLAYELSFLACDGMPLKSKTWTKKFDPKNISHELSVKQEEIFGSKQEAYTPENVLTVSCKMWKARGSISKAGHCTIQSVIGVNTIQMQSTIDKSLEYQTVDFTPNLVDISWISFDICINYDLPVPKTLTFRLKSFKRKELRFLNCQLSLFTASGKKKYYSQNPELYNCLSLNKHWELLGYNFCNVIYYAKRDLLTLQLEMEYCPAVKSERIDYGNSSCDSLSSSDHGIESVSTSNSETEPSSSSKTPQASEHEEKHYHTEGDETESEKHLFDSSSMGPVPSTTLKRDLITLHDDNLFCDTKLLTDTETFPAHRCVLSARSPVFKKMFTTDMKEKAGEGVHITDISSDTVRRMLRFLYTDCTGDLDMQSAKDLYVACDKYDIPSLKQHCLSFLKKNLCPSTVCEVLVLADMHQDKDLESAAQEYVLNNDEEVLSSDEWKLFMQSYIALAAQVMYMKCMKK